MATLHRSGPKSFEGGIEEVSGINDLRDFVSDGNEIPVGVSMCVATPGEVVSTNCDDCFVHITQSVKTPTSDALRGVYTEPRVRLYSPLQYEEHRRTLPQTQIVEGVVDAMLELSQNPCTATDSQLWLGRVIMHSSANGREVLVSALLKESSPNIRTISVQRQVIDSAISGSTLDDIVTVPQFVTLARFPCERARQAELLAGLLDGFLQERKSGKGRPELSLLGKHCLYLVAEDGQEKKILEVPLPDRKKKPNAA